MNTKEKGEHLILTSEDYIRPICGCDIANGVIKYCPLHESAPNMYEALKELEHYAMNIRSTTDADARRTIINANKALAKAEEK